MEAVGILARGVAHDFNNVLAAILGCSDLMVARLGDGDPFAGGGGGNRARPPSAAPR